ncbi:hypothetical protein BaRGS_00023153 [Batillaria attramentaria]|uniref:Uncharacterized protein n=1 Tax=Batillaria attramentaria TaxID=370345 RepID=A0ABD0KEN8_9CAEN
MQTCMQTDMRPISTLPFLLPLPYPSSPQSAFTPSHIPHTLPDTGKEIPVQFVSCEERDSDYKHRHGWLIKRPPTKPRILGGLTSLSPRFRATILRSFDRRVSSGQRRDVSAVQA